MSWSIFIVCLRTATLVVHPIAPPLSRRIRRRLFRFGSRGVLWITGMRVNVIGTSPRAPYFLVANHLSLLDIFLMASQLGAVFVSRGDLQHWPVFGLMARSMNTIFLDRENLRDTVRVNELLQRAMDEGDGVVIFPEGTVSQSGEVMAFKSALLETPVRLGYPVHYATIHYETPRGELPASEIAIWRKGVSFLDHFLTLAALPYYTATLTFGDEPIVAPNRKQLAEKLHHAVNQNFEGLA